MDELLPHILAGVLVLAVVLYVVLDGFDLGIGILFPFAPGEESRDAMMASIAPVWDGNETWLVLGGMVLFAGFPMAYGILLPAFYIPVVVMLVALICRGVTFEFRAHGRRGSKLWNGTFLAGSTVATFAQGTVLGGFIQGVQTREHVFAGGTLDWLTPFSLLCGAALVCGYALLGATWLAMKLDDELAGWARRAALVPLAGVLAAIGAVSLWTPLMNQAIAERWFSWPNIVLLSPVPIATAAVALALLRSLRRGGRAAPFMLAIALFLLSFLGLGISIYPYIAPPSITVWQAAAHPSSLAFLLAGIAVVLPVVLGYTVYTYRVFRGPVDPDSGYN